MREHPKLKRDPISSTTGRVSSLQTSFFNLLLSSVNLTQGQKSLIIRGAEGKAPKIDKLYVSCLGETGNLS